jgi:SAM-dependent methyltransferase
MARGRGDADGPTGRLMKPDDRTQIYRGLQEQQTEEDAQTHQSARRILSVLREYFELASLLDVGCGLGAWLQAAREIGIQDVRGIEGPWLDRSKIVVNPELIQVTDLEQPFSLGRRFDLVICLEVGEHLTPTAASKLVASLVAHGDRVLFSAAIPFQGGTHHINEQFVDYWVNEFARHGYHPLDVVRGRIWNDDSVFWWLRQNSLLYCSAASIEGSEKLKKEREVLRPLSVVHPVLYAMRLNYAQRWLAEYENLLRELRKGGQFTAHLNPDGSIRITRSPIQGTV